MKLCSVNWKTVVTSIPPFQLFNFSTFLVEITLSQNYFSVTVLLGTRIFYCFSNNNEIVSEKHSKPAADVFLLLNLNVFMKHDFKWLKWRNWLLIKTLWFS